MAFGGAGSALGGTCLVAEGAAEVDLGGMASTPPIRSTSCIGALLGGTEPPETFLSTVCFSLTKLNGTSSSPATSKVAGSGLGPSIAHRFNSYFVRIKFSIFDSDGRWLGASLASKYLFARALPHDRTDWSCSSVQESRSTDLTRLMWVPMPRWMPEQRMQMKTPRFQEAHRGSMLCQMEMVRKGRGIITLVFLAIGADLVRLQL